MLHARTGDALDLGVVGTLFLQSLQNEVNGFEPQGDGRKHLALIVVVKDALLKTILGEVGVEVDLGFVEEFEVGADDNT
jgi:hypothetical protein